MGNAFAGARSEQTCALQNHGESHHGPCRVVGITHQVKPHSKRFGARSAIRASSPMVDTSLHRQNDVLDASRFTRIDPGSVKEFAGARSDQTPELQNHATSELGPCRANPTHHRVKYRGRGESCPPFLTDPINHFNLQGSDSPHRSLRRVGYANVSRWRLCPNEAEQFVAPSLELPLSSRQNRVRGAHDARVACHITGAEDLLPAGTRRHVGADAPPSTTYVRFNNKVHSLLSNRGRKKSQQHLTSSDDLRVCLGSELGSLSESTASPLTVSGSSHDSQMPSTPRTPRQTSQDPDRHGNDSYMINLRKHESQMKGANAREFKSQGLLRPSSESSIASERTSSSHIISKRRVVNGGQLYLY